MAFDASAPLLPFDETRPSEPSSTVRLSTDRPAEARQKRDDPSRTNDAPLPRPGQGRRRTYWTSPDLLEVISQQPKLMPLPYLKEAKLIEQAQQGDVDARNTVWRHHLRLVLSVINRFRVPHQMLSDVYQEGCIGLERAIMRFEVQRYGSFSTYAWFWIAHYIRRCLIRQMHPVHVPEYLYTTLAQFRSGRNRCRDRAEWHDWRTEWLDRRAEDYRPMLGLWIAVSAENVGIGRGLLARQPATDHYLIQTDVLLRMKSEIERLPSRSQRILERRYGLNGGEPVKLQTVAIELGLTRERVRQLQADAEALLRKHLVAASSCLS